MGNVRFYWFYFALSRVSGVFRRSLLSKRSLVIAGVCAVYLCFVVSQIQFSQQRRDRRNDKDKYRDFHGLDNLGVVDLRGSLDLQHGANIAHPTRSNVVYITLKSKRLKPTNLRATVRPKLRRKTRMKTPDISAFTHNKPPDGTRIKPKSNTPWRDIDYKSAIIHKSPTERDSPVSSIRIYSERAPPWFSERDVRVMRFLADAKVLRVKEVSRRDSQTFLLFEGEADVSSANPRGGICGTQCGVIYSPVDTVEVFAFHLDRVLGLNRTLPAVSRKFTFLYGGQPSPVVSWEASSHPDGLSTGWSTVRITWGQYQSSLKQKCWLKNIIPGPDSSCSTIHHHEWSKLALFDFLLQIHNRLDQGCCGFRPRQEDECVKWEYHSQCKDPEQIQLVNIIYRGRDPRHLVFSINKGYFDRNEDNLDFRLLEGIKELPERAVSVLRSKKLREKLLQSLFLDQMYWESQGGRQGIDKLIDVIERRAKVLLTYINAHGIKVIAMNS